MHSVLGTSGYSIPSEVLKLPSLAHVRRLRAAAAPIHSGVQHENIRVSTFNDLRVSFAGDIPRP